MNYFEPYADWDCVALATAFGQLEIIKILEETEIDKSDNPAVWEAATLTHRNNILESLIAQRKGSFLNEMCLQKGIEGAAKGNNLEGLKLLLPLWDEVQSQKTKRSPLPQKSALLAALFDNTEILKMLLSKGAEVNAMDKERKTLLHIAAENDSIKIGKLLITNGANINAKDGYGQTPLHIAAKSNSIMMVKFLLSQSGTVIDSKDEYGWTPLHFAAENDFITIGGLLIAEFADIDARSKIGKTPLNIARRHDSQKMKELLLSCGAHDGIFE